ncbi:haloacid dehalogenase type II [Streptomyces ardesiacus]|uniref:haloacid dehalogenase type II n=1 Tax=Streptomyces ardesiacus TaxID=285564 RepID=UPI0006E33A1E|nr:haloacid dehalogenase type II [Streptomyces sp. NBRC 110030]
MPQSRPQVLVFDVNETLSDLTPLRHRFEETGASADLLPLWFAGILRDGFALTAAGGPADFSTLAADSLRWLLTGTLGPTAAEEAARHIVAGFAELDVHPDVVAGVRSLRSAGHRLVTMTNGSAALSEKLLTRAGIRDCFEALLDVTGPGCWKPDPRAYHYAVERCGVGPEQAMLVAVHPWDIDGAQRAGLSGAWLRRGVPDTAYPRSLTSPTLAADDLTELARLLG